LEWSQVNIAGSKYPRDTGVINRAIEEEKELFCLYSVYTVDLFLKNYTKIYLND